MNAHLQSWEVLATDQDTYSCVFPLAQLCVSQGSFIFGTKSTYAAVNYLKNISVSPLPTSPPPEKCVKEKCFSGMLLKALKILEALLKK